MKNPHVAAIGKLNLTGNIIPSIWWQRLRLESGAPDFTSVVILAEIVYWFKPTIVRDEHTGLVLEIKQKFRADKLQRSYQSFADQFGLSKKQVREAIQRLTERQLITTEFRLINVNNTPLNNVLFIDVNPIKIEMLSSIEPSNPVSTPLSPYTVTGSCHASKEGLTPQGQTYTDISSNTSTDISTNIKTAAACDKNKNGVDLLESQNPLISENNGFEETTSNLPTLINGFNDLEENQGQSQNVKTPIIKEKSFAKKESAATVVTNPLTGELIPVTESLKNDLWVFVQSDGYWTANKSCKTATAALKFAITTAQRPKGLMAQFFEHQASKHPSTQTTTPVWSATPVSHDW